MTLRTLIRIPFSFSTLRCYPNMASSLQDVDKKWHDLLQGQRRRRIQYDREDKKNAIKHQKELDAIRMNWMNEEKELLKKHLEEDVEKRAARAAAEDMYVSQHREAIRDLEKSEPTAVVEPKKSSSVGPLIPKTPPTKIRSRVSFVATPPAETTSEDNLTPYEQRRNANRAHNNAMLEQILPLSPPPAKRQRFTPCKAEDESESVVIVTSDSDDNGDTSKPTHQLNDAFGGMEGGDYAKHRIVQQASMLRNFFMVAQ